jgi:phage terminase large subunit-like protein
MPRRLLRADGHDRNRSLGWLATWWIETFCVHGPGAVIGQPVSLTDEYTGFIVDCYALDSRGRRLYDSAFFSRPKGCNKSGLAADLVMFEAFGPARFDGFAEGGETYEFMGQTYEYVAGEPMGKTVISPDVRILATEEEQAGNVYAAVYLNLTEETAPLFRYAQAYGLTVNKKGVLMPSGGSVRPSTSGSASKDGGNETFAVFDETHLYVKPELREMFSTLVRNLEKRRGSTGTWYLETTTMYRPGQDSIAEQTYNAADLIEEGRLLVNRQLFDHRWGEIKSLRDPIVPSTEESRRWHIENLQHAFREAYGDALEWNDLESLVNGVFNPMRKESDTRRYFLNALTSSTDSWVPVESWSARNIITLIKSGEAQGFLAPAAGDMVTLGFDGARSNDATALVACRVSDHHLFPLLIREQPDGPEGEGWTVDRDEFDAEVRRAFERFHVVGFYADPPYWQEVVNGWERDFSEDLLVHADGKNSIRYWTKHTTRISQALELLQTAIADGTMTQSGHKAMTRHFLNARVWRKPGGDVIGKETKNSVRKIDAAMAATLAFQAAADYENRGTKPADDEPETAVPVRVR